MSPISKRKCLWRTFAFSLCALVSYNCSEGDSQESTDASISAIKANVSLQMNYASTPLIDSLVIDCYGADTLHLVRNPENPNFDLELFPNDKWTFKSKLYANGTLMQIGEISTKLEAGSKNELNIQMHPLVGFVYVEIPLGFGNPTGIVGGNLTLNDGENNFDYSMEINGSNAIFKSDGLSLGKNYSAILSLYDQSNTVIYEVKDSFYLDEKAPIPELQIKSLRAKLNLAIKIANEVNMQMSLSLPAVSRSPIVGDIVISEIFSAPTSGDSSQYEFIEIYNGSLDTLDLTGCSIGTTSNKSWNLILEDIAPAQVVVLGNVNSNNTPVEYRNTEAWSGGTNALGNSSGSVIFQCNGTILDSLFYKDSPDSLHTNVVPALSSSKNGRSAQLDITRYDMRNDSSSWCLGSPTPGTLNFCD